MSSGRRETSKIPVDMSMSKMTQSTSLPTSRCSFCKKNNQKYMLDTNEFLTFEGRRDISNKILTLDCFVIASALSFSGPMFRNVA